MRVARARLRKVGAAPSPAACHAGHLPHQIARVVSLRHEVWSHLCYEERLALMLGSENDDGRPAASGFPVRDGRQRLRVGCC